MKIQVFGSGCPSCKNLYAITQKVVAELEPDVEVEYSTDIQKVLELGVMQLPVLVIDGQVVFSGYIGGPDKVRETIEKFIKK